MSDEQDKLSSLLDEFSNDEQSRQVLDEVEGDVNLRRRMFRYQMIGESLRGELPRQIDTTFSAGVMNRIDQLESSSHTEEASSARGRFNFLNWSMLKPFAGPAVAFSVALVAVNLWYSDSDKGNDVAAVEPADGMYWTGDSNSLAMQQKLNGYLVNHVEYSSQIQGLIPQVRVVGFDVQQVPVGLGQNQ